MISVALKATGDRENMNALRRGIRASAAPLVAEVRQSARERLPKSGGLNEFEASQRITVSTTTSVRSTGVRIKGRASQATDTGTWRHPTFGNRAKGDWVNQSYPGADGWWTKPLREGGHVTTALVEAQLEAVAAKIRAI